MVRGAVLVPLVISLAMDPSGGRVGVVVTDALLPGTAHPLGEDKKGERKEDF